jgi:hypothetical protein
MPIHHTGSEHPAFKRALDSDPEYSRWFYIYGDDYEKFMNVRRMHKRQMLSSPASGLRGLCFIGP